MTKLYGPVRTRLERAAALFALARDDEAGTLFRDLRRAPNRPPSVRRKVDGFLGSIFGRRRLRVNLDLGLWYEGNVNNAAEMGAVAIPAFDNLEFEVNHRPAWVWVARTGASPFPWRIRHREGA